MAGRVAAQNTDQVGPPEAPVLTEVLVTAQKRTSTVQSTPLSLTAVTMQDIENSGVTSAQDIAQLVPGMAIASAGPGQAVYEIRGLSADAGESPTIGFYLDETPITPPALATSGKSEIDPDLYDLQRVEVLRGPQGTLYGSGSMGGTVKLVTTPPQLSQFQSSVQTILSGTKDGGFNYAGKGMLNLPVIADAFGLRLVASYDHESGYIDRTVVPNFPLPTNPAPGVYGTTRGNVIGVPGSYTYSDVNDTTTTSVRLSALIVPTPGLTITPAVFYQKIEQGGINAYDSSPGTFTHYEPFDIAEPFSDTFTVGSLTVGWDADPFTVTSATGYWTRRSSQDMDGTESLQNFFLLPGFSTAAGGLGPVYGNEVNKTWQFSQEVRIASREEGPWRWLIGGFYSKFNAEIGSGNTAPGAAPLLSTDIVSYFFQPLTIKQTAGFANLSRTVGRLTLMLGARYYAYTSDSGGYEQGFVYTGSGATNPLPHSSASASGVLPLLNVSYAYTPDLLLYTSAAKGFREGAGLPPAPNFCVFPPGVTYRDYYDPDSVWTYELGEKARFASGRVTLNSALYLTQWSNVQQPVALPSCGISFLTNGPNAEVKGGEIEIQAELTQSFSLSQSVGYTHAVFTEDFPPAEVTSGERLLDVPEWTATTMLRFQRPISEQRKLFAALTNSYRSGAEEITDTRKYIPARDITNARMGVDAGKWTLALFVNNLFNQRKPIEYLNLLAQTGPPYDRIAVTPPLTAGVEFNVAF